MKYILDATVFFADYPVTGECYTTPSVVAELLDMKSKVRYDLLTDAGLQVCLPDVNERARVRAAAEKSGIFRFSPEPIVTSLPLPENWGRPSSQMTLRSRTWPLALEFPFSRSNSGRRKKIRWKFRCSGCGRYFKSDGECPVCGSTIKRKLK